jgi:hypothetical protein
MNFFITVIGCQIECIPVNEMAMLTSMLAILLAPITPCLWNLYSLFAIPIISPTIATAKIAIPIIPIEENPNRKNTASIAIIKPIIPTAAID